MLKISEIFGPTLQGEGPYLGRQSVFIRLFGCVPPYCSFCDSKYSWNQAAGVCVEMSLDQIKAKVNEIYSNTKFHLGNDNRLIIITGGEPFAQEEVYALANFLLFDDPGLHIQFETSGKVEIKFDKFKDLSRITTVMSPKTYRKVVTGIDWFEINELTPFGMIDAFKFVVKDKSDIAGILDFCKNKQCFDRTYLMPIGATRKEQLQNMEIVANLCIEHNFKMSPRLHTLIWDNKRRV